MLHSIQLKPTCQVRLSFRSILFCGAAAAALTLLAATPGLADNRWGNSQNPWGNAKNPWAHSQNPWGRTPSPQPGKPSNYGGNLTVPSGPIVDNPAMNNTIPDGLRAPPPKKRKARRPKPPSEAPAKKPDRKD